MYIPLYIPLIYLPGSDILVIFNVYSMYILYILYSVNTMYIPCIYIVYTMYILSIYNIHGYPWISIMYIPRISMDIHVISMDIHGVSIDVYPWYIRGISMDIHRFLNPDFSAGPCCWSHSMRTQVCVIRVFHSMARHHGNGARG